MQNLTLCPECKLEYTSENPPKKLINCAHNICFNCLQKQTILCSIDRVRIQRRKYTTQAFQTNQQILKLLEKKNTPKLQKQEKSKDNSPKVLLSKSQSKNSRQKSSNQRLKTNIQLEQKTQVSDFKQIEEKVNIYQPKQKSVIQIRIIQSQKTESYISKVSQNKQISPKKQQLKKKQSPKRQKQAKSHFHTPKQLSPKRQGNSFEMCLLHSKKADLVCVEDRCLICVNCGLFGQHKQHTIIGYEQFLNKYSVLTQQCFVNFEQLQKVESHLNFEAIEVQINDLLSVKRKQQLNKIKDKSKVILNLIKLWQKQLITNLDNMIKFKKDKLLKQIDFEQLIMKKQEYLSNVLKMNEGLEDILNQQKIQKYIDFIDPKSKNSYILKQGQYLIMEIDNYTKMVQKKIDDEIAQFTYEFETIGSPLFKNIAVLKSKDINQIIKFKPITPHKGTTVLIDKNKKAVQSPDRNLLIEPDSKSGSKQSNNLQVKDNKGSPIRPLENSKLIFDESISPFNIKVNPIFTQSQSFNAHKRTQSFNNKSMQINRPHIKKNNFLESNGENALELSHALNKSEVKSSKNETRCVTQRDILGEKCENRKKKKMDLPQKQSKMFEQLLKDKLQVFDIRAGLGNAKILTISEQFPYSKKLKTVRLMQNKITDDIFPQLIHYCRDLHSLNLSYNLLTEKSLVWLEQQGFYLGDLPNIALSMNKIQLRNVKDRLEQLKKKGINVTV